MGCRTSARAGTRWLLAAWTAFSVAARSEPLAEREPPLETELEKALYAVGLGCGYDLVGFALEAEHMGFVERGLRDAALRREPLVNERAYHAKINQLLGPRRGIALAAEKEGAAAFLREAARWEGARELPGGALYFELRPGDGAAPGTGDAPVRVHFHGRLRDGTVFDSSVERGRPVVVRPSRLFPCWREALARMRTGGKSRVVCPADTAYGDQGTRRVPAGAALDLEIELLAVLP